MLAINCRHSAYGAGVNAPRHTNIALLTANNTHFITKIDSVPIDAMTASEQPIHVLRGHIPFLVLALSHPRLRPASCNASLGPATSTMIRAGPKTHSIAKYATTARHITRTILMYIVNIVYLKNKSNIAHHII